MILLKNFSFFSQFNKDIIQMCDAKVKRYFNFISPKKKKLVKHQGCNSGGPDGVEMSRTFLELSQIISNYINPARGLHKLDSSILIYAI